MIWLGTIIFLIFGVLNINDPDWFIWVPIYFTIATMPILSENILSLNIQKKVATVIFILGCLIFFEAIDISLYNQTDTKMINLWEYQREGFGLVLGSFWLFIQKRKPLN